MCVRDRERDSGKQTQRQRDIKRKTEEGAESPEIGVTYICELPDKGTEINITVL